MTTRLHFLGANRQVTGSKYCLETERAKVLIDCGMFQEREFQDRNWEPLAIRPAELDAVVVTHAHIDHIGLLPRLVRDGFRGPIYATRATVDLAEIMLQDAARIQVEDAEYKRRRHRREGREGPRPVVPLYTEEDADEVLPLLRPVHYHTDAELPGDIVVQFHDAGHILGSAMLSFTYLCDGHKRKIVFSGDIGQHGKPLIRDPEMLDHADFVVMESTYGNRLHEDRGDIQSQLGEVIKRTVSRGGNVLIPTFAVERAQELTYFIGCLVRDGTIPEVPVFLDSPMAVDVTETFRQHRDSYDDESWALIEAGQPPLTFPGLTLSRTVQQSKAIVHIDQPAVIMATSGMCTAGRIKHHLRRDIGNPENTIVFVGYQGRGTLGRRILDSEPTVRIHGAQYHVRAEVAQIHGFSGHADRGGLIRWIDNFETPPREIFLTHGEEDVALEFADLLRQRSGHEVTVPAYQQVVRLDV